MTKKFPFTLSHLMAAISAVIISYASGAAIFYQAALALHSTTSQINSMFTSFALGCGILTLLLSIRFRSPIMIAWCSPGAAVVAGISGIPLTEAIGAFIVAALFIFLFSVIGWFNYLVSKIPNALVSAMLVGVLLNFGSQIFISMQTQLLMVALLLLVYFVSKLRFARFSLLFVLFFGFIYAAATDLIDWPILTWQMPTLEWVAPTWSLGNVLSLGVPLFIVTVLTQNVPGLAILRLYGYRLDSKPLISIPAMSSAIMAPLGAFMMNLAAISAAICMGEDVDKQANQRYRATILVAVLYFLIAILGGTVVAFFAALPKELVYALAGIAIFSTLVDNLTVAWHDKISREASLVTILTCASGLHFWGLGSAVWGLVFGLAVYYLGQKVYRQQR